MVADKLKSNGTATTLLETIKSNSEAIKHFTEGFDQAGDSFLARKMSHKCLDYLLMLTAEAKVDEPTKNVLDFARRLYNQSTYLLKEAVRKLLKLLDVPNKLVRCFAIEHLALYIINQEN